HDPDAARVDTVRLQIGEHELELVDELLLKHEILWPHIGLVVREKIAELEVLGHRRIRVLFRHLDEARGGCIRTRRRLLGPDGARFAGPVAYVVKTDAPVLLRRERQHADDAEAADGTYSAADGEQQIPDAGAGRCRYDLAILSVAHGGARRQRFYLHRARRR